MFASKKEEEVKETPLNILQQVYAIFECSLIQFINRWTIQRWQFWYSSKTTCKLEVIPKPNKLILQTRKLCLFTTHGWLRNSNSNAMNCKQVENSLKIVGCGHHPLILIIWLKAANQNILVHISRHYNFLVFELESLRKYFGNFQTFNNVW